MFFPLYNGRQPHIQLEMRLGVFFSIWKKLASATALSSFMVRKIRCQTHLSHRGPHRYLNLLSGHILIFSVWSGVHLGAPQQCNPHMDSKHFTVYLITIQIVPVLVWIRDFFSFSLYSDGEVPLVHMICLWGSLHLIKWASPSLWGLPIKVESNGNSMPPADSDWWSRCFITSYTPTTSLTRGKC